MKILTSQMIKERKTKLLSCLQKETQVLIHHKFQANISSDLAQSVVCHISQLLCLVKKPKLDVFSAFAMQFSFNLGINWLTQSSIYSVNPKDCKESIINNVPNLIDYYFITIHAILASISSLLLVEVCDHTQLK